MKLSDLPKMKNFKVILIGDPGSGKTCFATSFPTPIYCFDFDNKINSAARYHQPERIAEIEFDSYRVDQSVDAFNEFEKKLIELEQLSKQGKMPYKTIILDSLTQFNDVMLKALMKRNPTKRFHPNLPSQQDYHLYSMEFRTYMFRLINLDANIVITCHVQVMKDDITGEVLRMPQMSGAKSPKWLPTIFEEVYFCHRDKKSVGGIKYVAECQNEKYGCRTQIPKLPAIFEQSFETLIKGVE